ncbi:RING/U-box superfamily protein isoform 3 [Theobroma cacao]|uniref:RING/U-box superfamily protein isoform 3 n=1 Tax=Theobroma cacao TaxID=3641 RepID=A0A061DYZ6_THECC|nr:RING/U-box superfamily protein isoform 3 [Theobroma cacao]
MGAACCVAARDKTIVNGSGSEALHRNIRYSPTWSFRWDNRGRVAGEDTSISWFSDVISRNDGSEIKYESACASEDGSPSESFQSRIWKKSPISEGTSGLVRTPASADQSISRNVSINVNIEQVKESAESPAASYPSPSKLSLSLPSASSLATSPLSSQSHAHPTSSMTTRWPLRSPRHHLLRQVSDNRIMGLKSPNRYSVGEERLVMPSWSNESTGGSQGGSSDGWSMHAFSELMATSRRERWSFDSDSWGFHREKISRSSGRISSSPSVDLQTCGVCSKLLSEKSLWSSQKIIINNELSVVAVLTCGHVYHAECLENMTPEIDKYDPACPICTLGEKKAHKLSEKAFKAELDFKAKINKRSRSRVVDSDIDADPVIFNRLRSSVHEGKASSSSMKSSLGKPFLRKHFSFGSKGSRSPSENHPTRKKGFFWAKSSKI